MAVVMLGAGDPSNRRYERLGHEMICACGCGQVLLECNHVSCPDSGPMIGELRDQMNGPNGGVDAKILDWFVAKYGATVLAAPIRGGFDNVAWIMPLSVFVFATIGTGLLVRMWSRRKNELTPAVPGPVNDDALRERIRRETEY
jgi:cytochrome c-type biogenesis protein CcmH